MADAAATEKQTVDENTRARLIALLRGAYPHPDFPGGPYERAADSIIDQICASTWNLITLRNGLETLDALAGGSFADLEPEAAEKLLREIEGAEFFRLIRGLAIVAIYDDHEVWELLGYEGASFDKGGYIDRGFDDLDWLPDPRVTEYDGPEEFVEVASADEPKGARA